MANIKGEKELKTEWPVTSGLTAETTRQHGRTSNLVAQEGSKVPAEEKQLLDGSGGGGREGIEPTGGAGQQGGRG